MDVGSMVSGVISGVGGMIDTGANYTIAKQNRRLQKQQFNYQKSLNNILMQREDDAVQRRVADLKAAGLSPVLAAGSAASSTPLHSAPAPQMDFKSNMQDRMAAILGAIQMEKNISKTVSENKLIDQQFRKTDAETQKIKIESGIRAQDYKNMKQSGVSSNPSVLGKMWNDIVGSMDAGILRPLQDKIRDKVYEQKNKQPTYESHGASGSWENKRHGASGGW